MTKQLIAAAAAITLMTAPLSVLAQDGTGPSEEENTTTDAESTTEAQKLDSMTVTATRRTEAAQDVPLSVTVMSQSELTEKGIVGYEGLSYETPGVVLNRASANFNNFTARGIATNGYNANLQSTVAIYIDELPISSNGNSTILDPSLYDVERVEFLRGPQGTLFGSGSLAGALRIVTRDPDPNIFEASVLADLGVVDSDSLRQRYNAMVNIPMIDDELAFRFVGFSRHEEGYIDNIGTGIDNANTLESWGGRGTLLWSPTERFAVKLRISTEDSTPKDSSLVNPALGEDVRRSDRPDLFTGQMNNYNATIEYQFDGAHLTSSSTWSEFDDAKFFVDLAGTFGQTIPFALDATFNDETFVQETRLVSDSGGPLEWVVGGFYFERERIVDYNYRSTQEFLDSSGITGLPDEYYQRFQSVFDSHEQAVFGELTYHFSEDFWTTAGLRYGSTDARGTTLPGGYNSNYLTNALLGITGPLTITPIAGEVGEKAEETGVSYRFSASWRPVPSITTYATVATGFRAPIVNAYAGRESLVDPDDLVIPEGADSDELINYELGLKGNWMDNRLKANLALYYIDWDDIQVQANRVSDQVQFATNIGGAYSQGIEFDLAFMPGGGWTIALNGAYNEAEVDDLTPEEAAISGAVEGARLAGPEWSGSLLLDYSFRVFGNALGNASLSASYVGDFPGSFPFVPGQPGVTNPTYDFTESYTIVDASLGAAFRDFDVRLYVENVFDDRSINYVHPEAFLDSRYGVVRPRTAGIRVEYWF